MLNYQRVVDKWFLIGACKGLYYLVGIMNNNRVGKPINQLG